mgnify:CR=1 FL=1
MILEPQLNGIPVPRPSGDSLPYWHGAARGELLFQRCPGCGAANFGPGVSCRECRSGGLVWERSVGAGAVYSWTVVWRPQTPAFAVPYAPAIVRLDEGYDMVSALVGLEPEAVEAGLRVTVRFHRLTDEIHLPFFGPA